MDVLSVVMTLYSVYWTLFAEEKKKDDRICGKLEPVDWSFSERKREIEIEWNEEEIRRTEKEDVRRKNKNEKKERKKESH